MSMLPIDEDLIRNIIVTICQNLDTAAATTKQRKYLNTWNESTYQTDYLDITKPVAYDKLESFHERTQIIYKPRLSKADCKPNIESFRTLKTIFPNQTIHYATEFMDNDIMMTKLLDDDDVPNDILNDTTATPIVEQSDNDGDLSFDNSITVSDSKLRQLITEAANQMKQEWLTNNKSTSATITNIDDYKAEITRYMSDTKLTMQETFTTQLNEAKQNMHYEAYKLVEKTKTEITDTLTNQFTTKIESINQDYTTQITGIMAQLAEMTDKYDEAVKINKELWEELTVERTNNLKLQQDIKSIKIDKESIISIIKHTLTTDMKLLDQINGIDQRTDVIKRSITAQTHNLKTDFDTKFRQLKTMIEDNDAITKAVLKDAEPKTTTVGIKPSSGDTITDIGKLQQELHESQTFDDKTTIKEFITKLDKRLISLNNSLYAEKLNIRNIKDLTKQVSDLVSKQCEESIKILEDHTTKELLRIEMGLETKQVQLKTQFNVYNEDTDKRLDTLEHNYEEIEKRIDIIDEKVSAEDTTTKYNDIPHTETTTKFLGTHQINLDAPVTSSAGSGRLRGTPPGRGSLRGRTVSTGRGFTRNPYIKDIKDDQVPDEFNEEAFDTPFTPHTTGSMSSGINKQFVDLDGAFWITDANTIKRGFNTLKWSQKIEIPPLTTDDDIATVYMTMQQFCMNSGIPLRPWHNITNTMRPHDLFMLHKDHVEPLFGPTCTTNMVSVFRRN